MSFKGSKRESNEYALYVVDLVQSLASHDQFRELVGYSLGGPHASPSIVPESSEHLWVGFRYSQK